MNLSNYRFRSRDFVTSNDSSRFWLVEACTAGQSKRSLKKKYIVIWDTNRLLSNGVRHLVRIAHGAV